MTVRHGIEVLRAEGVIVSREKRGHFVAQVPGPVADGGPAGGDADAMTQLRAVREELEQVRRRLDRLEEVAPAPDQLGGLIGRGRPAGRRDRTAGHLFDEASI